MKSESVYQTARKVLLNSTLTISKSVYSCFASAFDRGAIVNNKIMLYDYNNLGMGYGLKALEQIPAQSEIFKIPLNTGLNGVDMVDMIEDERKSILKALCNNISNTIAPEGAPREKMYQT